MNGTNCLVKLAVLANVTPALGFGAQNEEGFSTTGCFPPEVWGLETEHYVTKKRNVVQLSEIYSAHYLCLTSLTQCNRSDNHLHSENGTIHTFSLFHQQSSWIITAVSPQALFKNQLLLIVFPVMHHFWCYKCADWSRQLLIASEGQEKYSTHTLCLPWTHCLIAATV